MKINFVGDISELKKGICSLENELGFRESNEGINVTIEKSKGKLEVQFKDGKGLIRYNKNNHFFRGLGLMLQHLKAESTFSIIEEPQFSTVGPMFDLSRNATMNMDAFKLMLRKMAIMGLNSAMLYMEDTYEIKDQPYFGYMRGRYTYNELKELDEYANSLGIELIPCIQTLAHLEEFLKWDAASKFRDTMGVLLVETEDVYKLIENMISCAAAPFRTKRIHIGMDEAEGLGRGRYLDKFGHKNRLDVMINHINKVMEVVRKLGLEPMVWSDMFLKLASQSGEDYYSKDTQISDDVVNKVPKELSLVYWDYYHVKEEDYVNLIKKHKLFGKSPVFTGGLWTWNGIGTSYGFAFAISNAALNACKSEGISDVFVSMWGDDGAENNFFQGLLGLQLYAEHSFARELDTEKLKERVKFCTGIDYDSFMNLKYLDEVPGTVPNNTTGSNPSKYLLWQDLLLGLFDKQIEGLNLSQHYEKLEKTICEFRQPNVYMDYIFEVPQRLCVVLKIKSELGILLKKSYDNKDKDAIKNIAENVIPELIEKVKELRASHRNQWYRIYKPFGWEVLDIRYGGVLSRLDTATARLIDYLEGRIEKIDELEQERLMFNSNIKPHENMGLGWCNYYYKIASPNVFFHVLPMF